MRQCCQCRAGDARSPAGCRAGEQSPSAHSFQFWAEGRLQVCIPLPADTREGSTFKHTPAVGIDERQDTGSCPRVAGVEVDLGKKL